MKKTLTYLIPCVLISVISCKEAHDSKLPPMEITAKKYEAVENANWLIGRWENNSAEGNLSEFWTKANDSTFHGESYFVIEKDTVFGEKVALMQRGTDFILFTDKISSLKKQLIKKKLQNIMEGKTRPDYKMKFVSPKKGR